MQLARNLLAGVCLALFASPVFAQIDPPTGELSGGYQVLRTNGGTAHSTFPLGWYVDFSYKLTDYTSIALQGGGSVETANDHILSGTPRTVLGDVVINQFMGGLRYGGTGEGRVTPFAQLLLGAARVWDDVTVVPDGATFNQSDYWVTRFAVQLGGGVSLRLVGRLGLRGEVGYFKFLTDEKTDHIEDFVGTGSAIRGGAGLVLWF